MPSVRFYLHRHTERLLMAPHARTSAANRAERFRLGRRAQVLAAASVTYNVVEAIVAITAGLVAGSIALVGFGLDSVVEVSSGAIVLWQFRHPMPEMRERQALRLMAVSFFALAAYVTFESVRALVGDHNPDSSPVGIALAVASLIVMPLLSWAQRRTGKMLNSNAVVADSTQTLLCTYLSAGLLAGLVLNATLGWSSADALAGLVIAAVAAREGREAWRGEGCCSPIGSQHADYEVQQAGGCGDTCCGNSSTPAQPSDGFRALHIEKVPDSVCVCARGCLCGCPLDRGRSEEAGSSAS